MEPEKEKFYSARIYKRRMQEIVELVREKRKKSLWERLTRWYTK